MKMVGQPKDEPMLRSAFIQIGPIRMGNGRLKTRYENGFKNGGNIMRRQLIMIGMLALLMGGGCATPYNPFKISQDQFYSKTKTIAIVPIIVPEDLEDPEPVKTTFESLIEAKLREAGFLVVPTGEYAAIWKQKAEQVGGYFDPLTGKPDISKLRSVREQTCQELAKKYNLDAILFPFIRVVKAQWHNGTAYWGGTSESLKPLGQKLLESLFLETRGTVPALSLVVAIQDIHGSDLYVNAGGIQVLSKMTGLKTFVPVPREQLFADQERNAKAVNLSLDALVKKPEKK